MAAAMMEKSNNVETKSETDVLELLFKQVKEPANIYKAKAVNVFDNAYRINIWSETYDDVSNLNKIKISHSYFCRLNGSDLVINL